MRQSLRLTVALVGVLVAGDASALPDYDGFVYSGTTLNGQQGGDGWTGAWAQTGTSSSVSLSNDGTSLSYPAMFQSPLSTPPTSGSRVLTSGAANSFRLMSETTSLAEEGNVLFASALIQKNTASGTLVDSILVEFVDAAGNRRFGFGIDEPDRFWINTNSSNGTGIATPGQTYFLVAKLETHAPGPEVAFLKIFGPGFATEVPFDEPTTWDVTTSPANTSNAILDRVRIRVDANNVNAQVDELRIGRTWLSVVPEPAALALLGFGAVALVRRRR